jgi:hypothetical protein
VLCAAARARRVGKAAVLLAVEIDHRGRTKLLLMSADFAK